MLPDHELEVVLARPPHPPLDPGRFTSNELAGAPGIYPDGPPMVPAVGPVPDDEHVERELARLAPDARDLLVDPTLCARVSDTAIRAALALLRGTAGEEALEAFRRGALTVETLRYGRTTVPGRVVGIPYQAITAGERCVSMRYRAEHFALLAPSLVHDLLWSGPGAGHAEETTLHALLALVHVQLLARHPELGEQRTELARRQHSLALTLLNSRHPDDARVSVVAPDGPGTIPGGAAALQSPDFWSVPFGPGEEDGAPVPPPVARTLARVAEPSAPDPPDRYSDAVGDWLSSNLGRRALPVRDQARAAVALGLLDGAAIGAP